MGHQHNEAIYLSLVNLICQGVSLAKGWQPRFLFVGDTDIREVQEVELDIQGCECTSYLPKVQNLLLYRAQGSTKQWYTMF